MILDLGPQAALNEAAMKPYHCGSCDVEWKSAGPTPCWLCDRIEDVEQKWPKIFADACQIDPVAPQ